MSRFIPSLTVAALLLSVSASRLDAQPANASTRMNELGTENGQMVGREGTWTVTETVWGSAGAAPTVTAGLVAERRMVGSILQETLRNPRDSNGAIERLDYLSFDRVEGRWKYVSMDTRAPVGIMTAESVGRANGGSISVDFQPFALAGSGQDVSGQMLRMREDIISGSANADSKDQYFTLSDGTGTEWLAHRYAYVRR